MNSSFMDLAIREAKKAAAEGEIPVGAVIVKEGTVLAAAHNRREEKQSALSHAETEAIALACERLGSWRLDGCEIYVTLEPCPMCSGAIIGARIGTLVFGAYERKAGCADSVVNLFSYPFEHTPEVYGGIREQECLALLRAFFKERRSEQNS